MYEAVLDEDIFQEAEAASLQEKTSYLERALQYREILHPIINEYLNPQNQKAKAQELQNSMNKIMDISSQRTIDNLYRDKSKKSKVLAKFIEELFAKPDYFGVRFDAPPSVNDRSWTKVLLIHDFIYYGPVTILSLCQILSRLEDLDENPIYLFLKQTTHYKQITEIRVNNYQDIYFEASNKIFRWQIPFLSDDQLVNIMDRIISETNLLNNASIKLNASTPIADFEHPCGYIRGSGVVPPAVEAPFMTLRIHPGEPYTLDDLMNFSMLDPAIKEFLIAAQEAGTTIAIAGTMGSGKTTLLSALSEYWPDKGRKATIEDTPELRPRIDDLVKMRTIEYDRIDIQNIDVARLTKACKRHSVRYVVLSEARDGSAWEILQLSQAILGCLMTFHYTLRSDKYLTDQALNTLVALCKQHPLAPQGDDIKHLIADMVQILILVEQSPIDNVRRIIKIFYVTGFDAMNGGHFKSVELFSHEKNEGYKVVNVCNELEDYFKLKGVNYSFK